MFGFRWGRSDTLGASDRASASEGEKPRETGGRGTVLDTPYRQSRGVPGRLFRIDDEGDPVCRHCSASYEFGHFGEGFKSRCSYSAERAQDPQVQALAYYVLSQFGPEMKPKESLADHRLRNLAKIVLNP